MLFLTYAKRVFKFVRIRNLPPDRAGNPTIASSHALGKLLFSKFTISYL